MQHPWIRKTKQRWKRWLLVGVVCFAAALVYARGQSPWENNDPLWEYEDDSPVIPIDVRLKFFNLDRAYNNAGDYHNDHFVREYSRREHPNAAFERGWVTFYARWVGFNDYFARFQRSILVHAGSVSVGSKTVSIKHSQLVGRTSMVLANLVETARDLTFYLEDDIVIKKWEIFIVRLENLEDTIKELKD